MRAGSLDREIVIETYSETQDEYGSPVASWTALATMRAEIVQSSTTEFFEAASVDASVWTIFRTRYVAGVAAQSRIVHEGRYYNVVEIKELGRRRGLELRAGAAE